MTLMEHLTEHSLGRHNKRQEETVADALTLAIHQHKIAPGTKLGEDELADIYGVSRTIIRSALQTLAHLNLVKIHRNRGAFVSQPSVQEAREVFEAGVVRAQNSVPSGIQSEQS